MNMKKLLFYAVSAAALIYLDLTCPRFPVFGFLFVVFIGLFKGSSAGCTLGFFIGLLEGIFSVSTFGVFSFSYPIVGYLSGIVPGRVDENSLIMQVIVSFVALIFMKAIGFCLGIFFPHAAGQAFSGAQLLVMLAAPAIFFVFGRWWALWFGGLTVERIRKRI
jgi:rod shape-determining protein MreD